MANDGSIIFNTKMDTSGFDNGVKQISSKVLELKNKMKSTENQILDLQEELKNLSNTEVRTKISEQLEKDVTKAKEKLNSLDAEADELSYSKNSGVYALKTMLSILGDVGVQPYKFEDNGIFCDNTVKAVKHMQKLWGYEQTGVVANNFLRKLGNEVRKYVKK